MSGFDQLPSGDLERHIARAKEKGRGYVGTADIREASDIARARVVEVTSSGTINEALSNGEITEAVASQLNTIGNFYHTYIQAQPWESPTEYRQRRAQYPKRLAEVKAAFLVLDTEENSSMLKRAKCFSYYGKRLSKVLFDVRNRVES